VEWDLPEMLLHSRFWLEGFYWNLYICWRLTISHQALPSLGWCSSFSTKLVAIGLYLFLLLKDEGLLNTGSYSLLKDVRWKTCLIKMQEVEKIHNYIQTASNVQPCNLHSNACRSLPGDQDDFSLLISSTCLANQTFQHWLSWNLLRFQKLA